jgi:hypothetical protein
MHRDSTKQGYWKPAYIRAHVYIYTKYYYHRQRCFDLYYREKYVYGALGMNESTA